MGRIPLISIFLFVFHVCWLPPSAAEPKSSYSIKTYWMCKNRKDVRTMRVQVDQKGICFTFYTKNGVDKYIGSGRNHNRCVTFLENIKAKLEESSWSCRDISDTKITENE